MIDLSQKARAGRTRALSLSRQNQDNLFFDAPTLFTDRQTRTRAKTEKLIGDTLPAELKMVG